MSYSWILHTFTNGICFKLSYPWYLLDFPYTYDMCLNFPFLYICHMLDFSYTYVICLTFFDLPIPTAYASYFLTYAICSTFPIPTNVIWGFQYHLPNPHLWHIFHFLQYSLQGLSVQERKELMEKGPFNLVFHGIEPDWIEMEMDDDPDFQRDVLEQKIKAIVREEVRSQWRHNDVTMTHLERKSFL